MNVLNTWDHARDMAIINGYPYSPCRFPTQHKQPDIYSEDSPYETGFGTGYGQHGLYELADYPDPKAPQHLELLRMNREAVGREGLLIDTQGDRDICTLCRMPTCDGFCYAPD